MISFHKEQNPPDQLRDIHRGGDIVVHALMPVFIFRGKVVVLGEDKERQKPNRGILHLEHSSHPQQCKTVHPKIGEHHREQSRQPFSGCAGPAIAGTPAQEQRAGRSAAPDSKSMSGSVPLRRLLTFVDKGIVKPKCPRNVTTAKKIH